MDEVTGTAPAKVPQAAVRQLLRWYRPYIAGHRRLAVGITVGTLVIIACQALVPWMVEVILHRGEWDATLLAILVGLVILQLGVGYLTHLGVHTLTNFGALELRLRLIDRLLRGQVLGRKGLRRSGVVLRVTQDVDKVSEAYETTLALGIPGLARLIVSLALLSVIDWRTGLTMTAVSLGFLFLRRRLGPAFMVADQHRLEIQNEVGESVDQTISGFRVISGLRLKSWQRARFGSRAQELEHATHQQGLLVNRLLLAAHASALLGLVAVVFFALAFSSGVEDLATVAAALLYVESAVRGLEALPPWVRDVQRARVAQERIIDVLDAPAVQEPPRAIPNSDAPPGLALSDVETRLAAGGRLRIPGMVLPASGIVGLVTASGVDSADLLDLLSGTTAPDHGSITLNGHDLRDLDIADEVLLVPAAAETLDATANELIKAVAPNSETESVEKLLLSLGLDDLLSIPGALDTALGSQGLALTVNERQRLLTAVALSAKPSVLMLGPLQVLSDADTAVEFVTVLRATRDDLSVIAAQTPEVAEAVDHIMFADGDEVRFGTHLQLLVSVPSYSALWEKRLATVDVDLSAIGIESDEQARLLTRLVTEQYAAGDLLYRQGTIADRILFIVAGHVEIGVSAAGGGIDRVAVLGPGNHCGDLRLTVGERRAENAIALDDCVVRSLSRQAIAAGITGLLDRTPTERAIMDSLLRLGPATREELQQRLAELDDPTFASALAMLVSDAAVREVDGVLSAALQRQTRKGAADLLDKLMDL
jgi:ABC-type branched-subunit amino acid transport system ATPase component